MVEETNHRVIQLVNELYHKNHIDHETTKKWLCERPNPPRIPVFYTLTKIHKLTPVGRPILSGCDGPTEKLSSFTDRILQPIAKQQRSYLKDTTDFINFIERTKVPKGIFLVSMDVTSLNTQTYHRRRESKQYAEHTMHSMKINLLSLLYYLKKCSGLF